MSQVYDAGKVHVIAYASWTLRPYEQSMHIYSSTKLELLALKGAVTENIFLGTICWGQSLWYTQTIIP